MFSARVRLLLLWRPLSNSRIVLWLSWYSKFFLILYPCFSINNFDQSIFDAMSSHPTNSDSHELLVFSFCLLKTAWTAPFPIVNTPPVCDLKSGCTAKLASTYHFSTFKQSALRVKTSFTVLFTYCRYRTNLPQSSRDGFRTRVVNTDIAVPVSGYAHLQANNPSTPNV